MNTPKTIPAALAVAAVLALSGCTADQPAQSPGTVAASDTASASPQSTEDRTKNTDAPVGGSEEQREIAREAARIMTTWTPGEDTSYTDAELRARELMTEERAAQVIAPERGAGGAEWTQAEQAGARSVPELTVNEAADTDAVEVTATWTWQTPEGDTLAADGPTTVRFYTFSFDPEHPEKIADYTYTERFE